MSKRPALSEESFLRHLFSPKKNPLPTGIRKRPVTFTSGRNKARVNAYNRAKPATQELLFRSGMRESYLRGETSLADAKRAMRVKAVTRGISKPLRQKASTGYTGTALDLMVASHIVTELRGANYTVDAGKVHDRIVYVPDDEKQAMKKWKSGQIRAYAGDSDNVIEIDGERFNPLWYR